MGIASDMIMVLYINWCLTAMMLTGKNCTLPLLATSTGSRQRCPLSFVLCTGGGRSLVLTPISANATHCKHLYIPAVLSICEGVSGKASSVQRKRAD